MNRYAALLAVAMGTLSGAAFSHTGLSGDISIETDTFVSTRSPAEVRAELVAYKKSGVNPWARTYNPLASFKSGKTRAQVSAEYVANRNLVAALNGEDSGSKYLSDLGPAAHQLPTFASGGAGGSAMGAGQQAD